MLIRHGFASLHGRQSSQPVGHGRAAITRSPSARTAAAWSGVKTPRLIASAKSSSSFQRHVQNSQIECASPRRVSEDVMLPPDACAWRLVRHPALEVAAIGVAAHPHAFGAGCEVEDEPLAVVGDHAARKKPSVMRPR